jgi:hypothetical protein
MNCTIVESHHTRALTGIPTWDRRQLLSHDARSAGEECSPSPAARGASRRSNRAAHSDCSCSQRSLLGRASWRMPDTYHQAGIERGTATSPSTTRGTTSGTGWRTVWGHIGGTRLDRLLIRAGVRHQRSITARSPRMAARSPRITPGRNARAPIVPTRIDQHKIAPNPTRIDQDRAIVECSRAVDCTRCCRLTACRACPV